MRLQPTSMCNVFSPKQRRRLCALLIAFTLVAINFGATSTSAGPAPIENTIVLDPASATALPGTFQVLHAETGSEYYPHVDCDVATYTYDNYEGSSTIHYQDLLTGADNVVPGDEVDMLSDISGSRIAYTEVTFSGETVRLFDTNLLTTTVLPGYGMSRPSIGGNLVAFEDRDPSVIAPGAVDLDAYDLSSGTVTKLAHDSFQNRFPDISPNGNALIWAQCATGDAANCNIYSAIRTSPGVFTTRALTTGSHESPFETSTDGQLAVYVSTRTGERDIYYQPVTGGNEVHLAIPGDQYSPTISGGLISFATGLDNGDLFVYDTRTGRLYKTVLNDLYYRLPEISVCGDTGRIVYSNVGNDFDVSAFTFQVPSVPADTQDQLNALIAVIRSFNLPAGTANSLVRKLQNAIDAVNTSDTATACSLLTSFINESQAQSGKKLTQAQSTQLITVANQIKAGLGCP